MPIKPPKRPRWATNDVYNATLGQNNVVEPSELEKDNGWAYQQKPPYNFFNWMHRLTDNWIEYIGAEIDQFAPHESDPQAMTITVDSGRVVASGAVIVKSVQTSGVITAPVSNPRIDRIVFDALTGVISIVAGTEAGSPVAPLIPSGKKAVCQVLLATSTTEITDADITDERTYNALGLDPAVDEIITGGWSFNNGLTRFGSSAPGDSWASAAEVLEVGDTGSLHHNGGYLIAAENSYFDGTNNKYQTTSHASRILIGGGTIELQVAASGAADANIAFIQALQIASDGGISFGSPTGGSQGPGTANSENGLFINGSKLFAGEYIYSYQSTTQSIANNTATVIDFNTTVVTSSYLTEAAGVYTVGTGVSLLRVNASVRFNAGLDTGDRFLYILLNGSTVCQDLDDGPVDAVQLRVNSRPIVVTNGDTISVSVRHADGAALGTTASFATTWLDIELLG